MKSKLKLILSIAAVVLVLDHVTKYLIVQNLTQGTVIPVIKGFFDIVHTRNTGAAFGFMADWDFAYKNVIFYIIGLVALVFLYFYAKGTELKDKVTLTAIGLILGGAMGNVSDRFIRGSVVDFLSVHIHNEVLDFVAFGYRVVLPLTWPAFNVADMAISVAVVFLVWQNIKQSFFQGGSTSP